MFRKVLLFSALIMGILFAISVAKSSFSLFRSGGRLQHEQHEVDTLERENTMLKQQIAQVERPEYVESVARNKLQLALPNETIIVVPHPQATNDGVRISYVQGSNWQRWYALFFK